MSERDYDADLSINPMELDIEWIQQPRKYRYWSELLAEAKRELDRAKAEVPIVHSKLAMQIRKNPTAFSIEKVTESTVEAAINVHADFIEITNRVIDLRYNVDILSSAVTAFEQRKTALENLVKLLGQQYFAAPTVPREFTKETLKKLEEDMLNRKIVEALSKPKQNVVEPRKIIRRQE